MANLLHATLVGIEWSSSWHWATGLRSSVGDVRLRVGARLRGYLLLETCQWTMVGARGEWVMTDSHQNWILRPEECCALGNASNRRRR